MESASKTNALGEKRSKKKTRSVKQLDAATAKQAQSAMVGLETYSVSSYMVLHAVSKRGNCLMFQVLGASVRSAAVERVCT
jgi:hypothetical protein